MKEENLSALDLGCRLEDIGKEGNDAQKEFESLLELANDKEKKFIEEWLSLVGKRKPWFLYKRKDAILKRLRKRILREEKLAKGK